MIAEGSIDVVVSNCVLNLVLVATEHKATLFDEIHRVLRRGGRAVISDIVSDVEVPETMRADPQLVDCVGARVELKTTGAMYRSELRRQRTRRGATGQPLGMIGNLLQVSCRRTWLCAHTSVRLAGCWKGWRRRWTRWK
jgi:SAM-dependent methyltransferase